VIDLALKSVPSAAAGTRTSIAVGARPKRAAKRGGDQRTILAIALARLGSCVAAILVAAQGMPRAFLSKKARMHLHRLRCERRAMALDAREEPSLLDGIYDATLDRLGSVPDGSAWWRRVMLAAEAKYVLPYQHSNAEPDGYVGPHFLSIPSLRQWLADRHVRADLKVLATETILATECDVGAIRKRLAQSYADHTYEGPEFANVPIAAAVDGLVAGALCLLRPAERLVVGLMRETNLQNRRTRADILNAIARIDSAAHSTEVDRAA
jgi:hypothetical protein